MPFPTYAKKDEIPAGAEDVYEESGGKWIPKLEDTTGLKHTVSTLRDEKKAVEKLAKEANEKTAAAERERDALKVSGGDVDAKTKALLTKWEEDKNAAVKAVQDQLDKTSGELKSIRLDDRAMESFLKVGGRKLRAKEALKLSRDRLDLAEDRIVVKDEKGAVSTETIEDYWGKSFRKSMPEFFEGTKAAGGGASGTTGGGGTSGTLTAEQVMANPALAFAAADAK